MDLIFLQSIRNHREAVPSQQGKLQKLQPNTQDSGIVHSKENLISLYACCFTEVFKFKVEPNHIEVNTSIPPNKTPYRPVLIHQQVTLTTCRDVRCWNPQAC